MANTQTLEDYGSKVPMKRRCFLLHSLLFVAGCTAATTKGNGFSLPSLGLEKLRLAISDAVGVDELKRDYEPFRAAVEQALEIPVEFFPVQNLFEATSALELDRVDLVWAGPSEYLIVRSRTNTVPLVGISRPKTLIVVVARADDKISSVADLKGKKIEVGRVGSTTSHLLPVRVLMDAGLDPKEDVKIVHSEEHGLEALQKGEVDAWARGVHRYQPALEQLGAAEEEYPILIEHGPIPPDVLIASNFLNPEAIEQIRGRLLERSASIAKAISSSEKLASKFEGTQIVAIADPDYDTIREVYEAISAPVW